MIGKAADPQSRSKYNEYLLNLNDFYLFILKIINIYNFFKNTLTALVKWSQTNPPGLGR
jgi:hypothetical protein